MVEGIFLKAFFGSPKPKLVGTPPPPLITKTEVKYYWILLSKIFSSYNGKLVYSFFKTPKHSFPTLYKVFYPSKTVLGTKIGAHGAGFELYHELIT